MPEPIAGKHHPNELDKLLKKTRINTMKHLAQKCDKLPNMEFKAVIEELKVFYDILLNIEQEVIIILKVFIKINVNIQLFKY